MGMIEACAYDRDCVQFSRCGRMCARDCQPLARLRGKLGCGRRDAFEITNSFRNAHVEYIVHKVIHCASSDPEHRLFGAQAAQGTVYESNDAVLCRVIGGGPLLAGLQHHQHAFQHIDALRHWARPLVL